ncbi:MULTISPECIES: glycoside hydrolase family 1 protein [unclassified Paenibacillus]|uniref:glycoside hydrolase family 1 protein n=1 Tax=unclassified Paenibacillus TaxID=185978 RepID=UPI003837E962
MKIIPEPFFPEGFLFGGSSSAFQAEGAYNQYGRGLSVIDMLPRNDKLADYKVAVDHYHRFEEDIKLMYEAGLRAYRFSMSWSRILPEGNGEINTEGIEFYNKVINLLLKYKIEPVVTIYHFDYPQGLVDQYGGWLSRQSIEDYVNYAAVLFKHFGDRVKYWLTINEQDHVIHLPERLGIKEKLSDKEFDKIAHQVSYHMCAATAKAIKLCHEMVEGGKIGPAMNPMFGVPASMKPEDALAAMEYNEIASFYLLDMHCKGIFSPVYKKYLIDRGIFPQVEEADLEEMRNNPPDYIGVNYYMAKTIEHSSKNEIQYRGSGVIKQEEAGIYKIVDNPYTPVTEWGWEICAPGLKMAIMEIFNRYNIPVLITENGLGAFDELTEDKQIHDEYRIEYLSAHLKELKECIDMGYPVIGYCLWSFMDLISGHDGMGKRYGLVYVNRSNSDLMDLARIKKKSYHWYANVIATNGTGL